MYFQKDEKPELTEFQAVILMILAGIGLFAILNYFHPCTPKNSCYSYETEYHNPYE